MISTLRITIKSWLYLCLHDSASTVRRSVVEDNESVPDEGEEDLCFFVLCWTCSTSKVSSLGISTVEKCYSWNEMYNVPPRIKYNMSTMHVCILEW